MHGSRDGDNENEEKFFFEDEDLWKDF